MKVWWTAGAQPPQLLSSGELAMSSAWNGRILAVMKEKAPVTMTYKDGIAWGNAWVVLKGTPHKDLAMKMINDAISEEAQTRLLPIGVYAPLNLKALAKATPDQRLAMATHPDNVKDMLILDEEAGAQLTWNPKYEECGTSSSFHRRRPARAGAAVGRVSARSRARPAAGRS